MTDKRDVSGVWYGRFAGTFGVYPNRFIAHLEEVGGSISGTTSEPDWMDAITVAITIGEARILPWPIRSAAFSVSPASSQSSTSPRNPTCSSTVPL